MKFISTIIVSSLLLTCVHGENVIEFLDLKGCQMSDSARLLTMLTGQTVVASELARDKSADVLIEKLPLEAALKVLCRSAGLVYRYDAASSLFTILALEEYQRTIIEDKQGEEETRVFKVGPANLNQIASSIRQLFGNRVILMLGEPIEDFREAPGQMAGGFNSRSQRISGSRSFGGNGGLGGLGTSINNRFLGTNPNSGFGGLGLGGLGGGFNQGGLNGFNALTGMNGMMGGGFGPNPNFSQQPSFLNSQSNQQQGNNLTSELALDLETARSQAASGSAENSSSDISERLSQPPIHVSISYEHNFLLVRSADKQSLKDIDALVVQLDQIVPQVILEMKILQLDVGDGLKAGVSFSGVSDNEQFGIKERDPVTADPTAREFLGFENTLGLGNFASDASATFAYTYLSRQIRARVDLLASDNRVEIIATPVLIATNNRSAQIEVGEERIITVGASTQSTIGTPNNPPQNFVQLETEKRTIGVTLDILPRINDDGTVTLSVYQESTTLKPANNQLQVGETTVLIDSVDTANVDATVVARDGCTIAIGGLIRTERADANSKVPLLGDIPLLGLAFKRKERSQRKTEIILLITPRILRSGDDPARSGSIVSRELMERVSDHRYHVGGDAILERDIPELGSYRRRATSSYKRLNDTDEVPEKAQYWDQLGAQRPEPPSDATPVKPEKTSLFRPPQRSPFRK